jgi:spermidine/putrescine transport system substrate-binding protein
MTFRTLLGAVSVAALGTTAFAQDTDLLVFDYSGFEEEPHHAAYIAQHGAVPAFAFFGDEDEAFQKIRAGFQADVAHICAGSVTKWTESGIIEPWDTSKLTYFGDLDSNLLGNDIANGKTYFIPTDFGSTAIAYNPEEVTPEEVASLDVFLNPKFAGRMTLPDNVDDSYALAYLATSVDDWSNATDAQFDAASDWLRQAHGNLRTYWTDAAELAQLMSTGEILVSWAWNETYPTMVEEGRPIGFQREATEGSSLWLCGYVNLKDGPGVESKAYDYLNSFLAPGNVIPLLDSGYGSANKTALNDLVGPEDLVAAGLEPVSAPLLAQQPMSNAARERQVETFELIKAGF